MVQISSRDLPDTALLARYIDVGHTDCFRCDLAETVTLDAFIRAFYTSWLFKMERFILRLVGRPSTDADVAALATAERATFAAWRVEDRTEDQILLCDVSGRTRSWLRVASGTQGTSLYFGSAVVPDEKSGKMGWLFHALMGFHKVYSIQLLKAAVRNL